MPNKLKNILEEYAQGILQIIGNDLAQIILYVVLMQKEQITKIVI